MTLMHSLSLGQIYICPCKKNVLWSVFVTFLVFSILIDAQSMVCQQEESCLLLVTPFEV